MKIEQKKISVLIPYVRNARKHDDAQVAKIAGSIREFGFNNPVLIDGAGGIIAGHGRVLAAQLLKMKSVPCIALGHLSETQKKAYILADNRLSEIGGGWDDEMLALELTDLKDLDYDLDSIGFDGIVEKAESKESGENSIPSVLEVICECESEEAQKSVYDLLVKKGYTCRLSTF